MTTTAARDAQSMPAVDESAAKLVIQQTLVPPDGHTKFVDQMVGMDNPRVEHRFFSWPRAILTRYDVFHVHWPELTIRAKTPTKRFLRRRYLDVFLLRAKILRTPIVRHLHNVEPHEPGNDAERRSLARLDRATDLYIRLNPTTVPPTDRPVVTALHGHYRQAYAAHPLPPAERGHLLYFGIIRPYKGVDHLARVFSEIPDPDLDLRIVGSPSVGQREIVEAHVARDPRISALLRYVSDAELTHEVGRAELAILPYREMHNSGAILVAMSLGRPVLAPRSPANSALSAEVGPGWIIEYDGDLTPATILDALAEVRTTQRTAQPDLSARDWDHVGRIIEGAYRTAIARARRR
ncbi:glycosyltransferase [Microbacterium sp. CFBP9034]|uniref:glycosyltransferase n=1 Tax=Microbacterium sp. CFBP9034 TaxID=3096540 RepID=UPI002A69DD58|nr:glycosyltransferase [Microbacterium sp. CFBP9034]MDY0910385.1 glycosyltransferase [Microbacterium sp. CFBP9034]